MKLPREEMTLDEYRAATKPPGKGRNVPHKQPEFDDQCAVFRWREVALAQYPELKYLFSTLNGVRVSIGVAVKMKRAGMTRGVLDLWLPVRRGNYPGLVIELKHGDGRPTEEQLDWIEFLHSQGYCVTLTYGSGQTIDRIIEYLEGRL